MADYPIYRLVKGDQLTFTEMDDNLRWLSQNMSGSRLTLTGSIVDITGSVNIIGDLQVVGTASIGFLKTIVFSSGSNQLGDDISDVQTLIGTVNISGSLTVTRSANIPNLTGSLFGTASWALNALSSSQAISASYAYTASSAVNSFNAITASHALTASSADNFLVRQNITASNALITGTITAQTLVVQTVTSSVIYSSGSNVFGNDLTNTQTLTGSVNVTGSMSVIGKVTAQDITGSLFGTASWALNFITGSVTSASYAYTASLAISSSYAVTASNFAGTGSDGFVSNMSDTYTSTAKITDIITLSSAEYAAIGSPSTSTLYIVI